MGRRFRNACDLWTLCYEKSRNVLGVSRAPDTTGTGVPVDFAIAAADIDDREVLPLLSKAQVSDPSWGQRVYFGWHPSKRSYWKPKTPVYSRPCEAIRSINIPRLSGNSKSGCADALRDDRSTHSTVPRFSGACANALGR